MDVSHEKREQALEGKEGRGREMEGRCRREWEIKRGKGDRVARKKVYMLVTY